MPNSVSRDVLEPIIDREEGATPFTSRRYYRTDDGDTVARTSRGHRKGLVSGAERYGPRVPSVALNPWIGGIFALGASLFALGCVLQLYPPLAQTWSLSDFEVNRVFFLGSIPFSTAAFLQLYQAELAGNFNSGATPSREGVLWRLRNVGWLSCLLQFAGTLLFNVNTLEAMYPGATWWQQDLKIWLPNFSGSVFFLLSGYLAFIETCHRFWAWLPGDYGWWVAAINLLGCVAFMASACLAFSLPELLPEAVVELSAVFTLIGAVGFFVGALLLFWEK